MGSSILRLRITLNEIMPTIWRQIEILSNASFWDLHVAIQDSMGWLDCHLHEFLVTDRGNELRVGIPDDSGWGEPLIPGWERELSTALSAAGDRVGYTYDFGDGWEHEVILEAIESEQPGVVYPRCIAGGRRCPPEDCGGPWGYERLLEVLADPNHEEHAELLEWVGGRFDPEAFSAGDVVFDDPKKRLESVLRG
jgi:hypothetical protein